MVGVIPVPDRHRPFSRDFFRPLKVNLIAASSFGKLFLIHRDFPEGITLLIRILRIYHEAA